MKLELFWNLNFFQFFIYFPWTFLNPIIFLLTELSISIFIISRFIIIIFSFRYVCSLLNFSFLNFFKTYVLILNFLKFFSFELLLTWNFLTFSILNLLELVNFLKFYIIFLNLSKRNDITFLWTSNIIIHYIKPYFTL